MTNNDDELDRENRLENRLGRRIKRKEDSVTEGKRLGDRLAQRIREYKGRKSVSSDTAKIKSSDLFDEVIRIIEENPELEDIKVSELRRAISEIGMKHPEEIIQKLKEEKSPSEKERLSEKWITY